MKTRKRIFSVALAVCMLIEGSLCTTFGEENELDEVYIESVANVTENDGVETVFYDESIDSMTDFIEDRIVDDVKNTEKTNNSVSIVSSSSPNVEFDHVITSSTYTMIVGDEAKIAVPGMNLGNAYGKGKAGSYFDGKFVATEKGKAKIIVQDGTRQKVVCKIKVDKPKIKSTLKLKVGKSKKLKLFGTKLKVDEWKSSNMRIATVTKDGIVKALGGGKATITARIGKHEYTCVVTSKGEDVINQEPVKLNYYQQFYGDYQNYKLNYNLIFSQDELGRISTIDNYDSNNTKIASVTQLYDEHGKCIRKYSLAHSLDGLYLDYNDIVWENGSVKTEISSDGAYRLEYTNAPNGNPVICDFYQNFTDTENYYMRDEYTYDSMGRVSNIHRKNVLTGRDVNIIYYYDGNNNEPSKVEWISDEGCSVDEYTYVYDDKNRLVRKEENNYNSDGSKHSTLILNYEY